MEAISRQPKGREAVVSTLNMRIDALSVTKEALNIAPAKAVFDSVSIILVMIRDGMTDRMDYVELGLACADVCSALSRGLNGKKLDDLNDSMREAISQLMTAVAAIQERIVEQGERGLISQHFHARSDKERIATWRLDLNRIIQAFNTELVINTHTMVFDRYYPTVEGQGAGGSNNLSTQTSMPGESLPLPPRPFFGRDKLVKRIVNLAEDFVPIALIGAVGIGKTSIALAVLHHDQIKRRFGEDRRFIRCDEFPATYAHFLRRFSWVIGAGIESPEDLTPLRTFLSSKKMLIVLDNAESILDPEGIDGQKIYAAVEELSQFHNICVFITSRISTTLPVCKRLEVPTLSMDAAYDAFYRIYGSDSRSELVNDILEQLDFHPLSITSLATVAHQNQWDTNRLAREWERQRTGILQSRHSGSLAAAIELSLASPTFRKLGPDARALLGVVGFFPQGVDENNVGWLFPTIPNGTSVLDKFCFLSLTYRSNGFIKMLAPLRDYLSPKDPASSSILCTTKERYFTRISVDLNPNEANFGEAQWIASEDINVEHLLDVFTTIDANLDSVWDACVNFMKHLYWHKNRPTIILGTKIEGLPDGHRSKPECLFELSRLFDSVGNWVERKRLLYHALRLWGGRGDDRQVARTLLELSETSRRMGLPEEGIWQTKEALETFQWLGDVAEQARCLISLAWLLVDGRRLDAAEEAASRAIDLLPMEGEQFLVCESHRALGYIYRSKGEAGKAIYHNEVALGIASRFNWRDSLFWTHYSLARLFLDEGRFDDAHLERAKSHTADNTYNMGGAMVMQAVAWWMQHKREEARSEALRAANVFKKLGDVRSLENCKELLRYIQK